MCWLHYVHLRRHSYREDETKEEQRQLRKLLQEGEHVIQKLRRMMASMQELEERCVQLQNKVDSTMNMMTRLSSVPTEQTVQGPASGKSLVNFGRKVKFALGSKT
jgi:Tfp pilus assembly protein PilO